MDQPSNAECYPLIILGAGPAGYTAALYALRAGIRTLLLEGEAPGGQLMTTNAVENWPGGDHALTGPELMLNMEAQVDRLGVIRSSQTALSIKRLPNSQSRFSVQTHKQCYQAQSIIVATGSRARKLNLPSEKAYFSKGVSTCATCDGFFYRDQIVAVVGGGNSAISEAIYLSKLANLTYLVHRGSAFFRAEKMLLSQLDQAVGSGKIKCLFNQTVSEVLGDTHKVTGVVLRTVDSPGQVETLPISALFLAIGHIPNTEFLADLLDRNPDGTLKLPPNEKFWSTQTSIPGIFAAGEVADPTYRQAITSAAMGCMAALDVQKYLNAMSALENPGAPSQTNVNIPEKIPQATA